MYHQVYIVYNHVHAPLRDPRRKFPITYAEPCALELWPIQTEAT